MNDRESIVAHIRNGNGENCEPIKVVGQSKADRIVIELTGTISRFVELDANKPLYPECVPD
jgi:Holliday junction resolvasome RuvABC DNA-binding subunit